MMAEEYLTKLALHVSLAQNAWQRQNVVKCAEHTRDAVWEAERLLTQLRLLEVREPRERR